MSDPRITLDEVEHVARLARLELSSEGGSAPLPNLPPERAEMRRDASSFSGSEVPAA